LYIREGAIQKKEKKNTPITRKQNND